ncbi:MAG: hypothetical protein ACM3NV_10325, partial [Syntrophothermus sp.]
MLRDRGEQRLGFIGRGEAFAAGAGCGKFQPVAGVDDQLAAGDGATADRPQRQEGDLDRGRAQTLGQQPIGEPFFRARRSLAAQAALLSTRPESRLPRV